MDSKDADGRARPQTTRRGALASLAGTAVGLAVAACRPAAAQGTVFTPEAFGARGDGRTDDYEALQRLAAAVSAAGGGTVRFGRGRHYLIDRYQIAGGPNRNGVRHITYEGCRGLVVDLNGSTIDVKGDFHRGRDTGRDRRVSFSNAVIPFVFTRCTNLTVRNGVLNGNVQRMTREGAVWEGAGHGISLLGCRRVLLEGLHIHHFSTDGLRAGIDVSGGGTPCQELTLKEVRLTNNARQGFSNTGSVGVVATDCEFSQTGQTGGAYGRHNPSAGVDCEPIRQLAVKADFRAVRCRFDGNLGAPIVSGNPDRTALIELIDCGGRTANLERMILSCERTVIRGGSWHNVQIACAYGAHRPFRTPIAVEVSGGLWTGDDPAWFPVYDANPKRPRVRIHNNRFRLLSPQPYQSSALFLCPNPNHQFEENEVFVSRTGHQGSGDDVVGQFHGAALVRGNRWSTDAAPPMRFVNNYQGVQRLEQESFSGSFAGVGRGR
ncbi:MAG TPA: hypothetical protein VGX37_03950 [Allosphingosinicella sp.]|nr:hypothetical protein [Allosphingosinicella sp.]